MAVIAVHAGRIELGQALREESLINRAREMDSEAWNSLYTAHHSAIYRYCFHRLGERTLSEDVAADVFLEAVRGIGRYRYRGIPFRAWLYRIAHNLVADQLRRKGAAPAAMAVADAPEEAVSEQDFADSVLDQAAIRTALVQLTEDQQQVIVMRFFEGLAIAEVAAAMGKRAGAIKQLQHRAIGRLRSLLEPGARE
ncbi:MAG: RNA polymerase sigma factor [Dehalococcoidia bacterium]